MYVKRQCRITLKARYILLGSRTMINWCILEALLWAFVKDSATIVVKTEHVHYISLSEGNVIKSFKNDGYTIINRCIAGRSKSEYRFDNRERLAQYRLEHRDKYLAYLKEYYQRNKQRLLQYARDRKVNRHQVWRCTWQELIELAF